MLTSRNIAAPGERVVLFDHDRTDAAGAFIGRAAQVLSAPVENGRVRSGVDHGAVVDASAQLVEVKAQEGEAVQRVPLYDPLSAEERAQVARRPDDASGEVRGVWAEWPAEE